MFKIDFNLKLTFAHWMTIKKQLWSFTLASVWIMTSWPLDRSIYVMKNVRTLSTLFTIRKDNSCSYMWWDFIVLEYASLKIGINCTLFKIPKVVNGLSYIYLQLYYSKLSSCDINHIPGYILAMFYVTGLHIEKNILFFSYWT